MEPPRTPATALALLFPYLYVSTHSLARQRLVARDSAKGRVQRMVVAGGRRGTPLCCHDYKWTTSGRTRGAVYWALGTYQGGGTVVACLGVWEERKRSEG